MAWNQVDINELMKYKNGNLLEHTENYFKSIKFHKIISPSNSLPGVYLLDWFPTSELELPKPMGGSAPSNCCPACPGVMRIATKNQRFFT